MKRPRVYLEWLDSKGVTDGWEFWDGLEQLLPSKIRSVGFLIAETEEYITIAQSYDKLQVLGRMTVPKRAIVLRKKF